MNCPICGNKLSQWNGRTVCSAACKQKKHRMKKGFGESAMKASVKVAEMVKIAELGVIEREQAIIAYNDLANALRRLSAAIDTIQREDY